MSPVLRHRATHLSCTYFIPLLPHPPPFFPQPFQLGLLPPPLRIFLPFRLFELPLPPVQVLLHGLALRVEPGEALLARVAGGEERVERGTLCGVGEDIVGD